MSHRRSAVCGREDPLVRDAHTLAMHVQQAFERPYGDVDPSAKNVGTDNAAKTDNTNATTSVAGGSTTANTSSKADLAAQDPISALLARDAVETELLTAIQVHKPRT